MTTHRTRIRTIAYRVSTGCAALVFAATGAADLMRAPTIMEGLAHLGYPTYFATILGAWQVLGAVAIIAPGLSQAKEWAYAGMVFTLSGAAVSHAVSGDPVAKILVPLVLLGAVLVSRTLRPAMRPSFAIHSARPYAGLDQCCG